MIANILKEQETGAADLPIYRVPLSQIVDNPYQPRAEYRADEIADLAHSIASMRDQLPATLGLQQPPAGRLVDADGCEVAMIDDAEIDARLQLGELTVQLAFGHKRSRAFAALAAGDVPGIEADAAYGEIPIYIITASDAAMLQQAIAENHQRSDISAVEEARALQAAVDLGMTVTAAGKWFGWSRSVARSLRSIVPSA